MIVLDEAPEVRGLRDQEREGGTEYLTPAGLPGPSSCPAGDPDAPAHPVDVAHPMPQDVQAPSPAVGAGPAAGSSPLRADLRVELVPLELIDPSPYNPRRAMPGDPRLEELTASIRAVGVLQPILVRPAAPGGERYEIVAGERRWAAARAAGLEVIPATVRMLTNAEAVELQVVENLQREDLTPLEESAGVQSLLDLARWSLEDVAQRIGRSRSWVVQRARLRTLSSSWRERLADPGSPVSRWPVGHLVVLARLEPAAQDLLGEAAAWFPNWVPRRDEIEGRVNNLLREVGKAPWAVDDVTLYPEAGSCETCSKRSGCHPHLFDEEDGVVTLGASTDVCLDAVCWGEKLERHVARREVELRVKHGSEVLRLAGRGEYGDPKRGVLPSWQVEDTRKGAEGARPAIVVCGAGAGSVRWVKVSEEYGPATSRRVAGPDGKPLPKPLEQRRAELAARRTAKALELLADSVASAPAPANLLAVAAVFGTQNNAAAPGPLYRWAGADANLIDSIDSSRSPWQVLRDLADPELALWREVQEVLVARLKVYSTGDAIRRWNDEASNLADLVGVDAQALMALAVEDIPEPKSWANLNADGTPKAKAARKPRGTGNA